jgi:DNA repair exonuclease SbcCD nuclease subunit
VEPFIITGDLQVKQWQQFSHIRQDGMNSRLHNCLRVFDIILKVAKERKIRRVLLNGDLLEDNGYIEVETYTGLYRKLEMLYEAGLGVVINLGNHDVYAQLAGRALHNLEPFGRLAKIVEEPQQVWSHVWCVPWMPNPEGIKHAIGGITLSKPPEILVLHCGVQGARTGPKNYLVRNQIKLRDVRPKEFSTILLSDYHTRQKIASNVQYLGSPLQHSFGEIHRPCIWIVSDRRLEKVYTNLPTFYRIKADSLREFQSKMKGHEHDYTSLTIPEGSHLRPEAAEKAASSMGAKLRIEFGRQEDTVAIPEGSMALNPSRAIQRFARKQNPTSRRKARRLQSLGLKLYRGEL